MKDKRKLIAAVNFLYDLQKLRIATFQRGDECPRGEEQAEIVLDADDMKFQESTSKGMLALEKSALKEVDRIASGFSIYEWLRAVKGIGPASAGILISKFDIVKAERPSQFWSFAGLAVVDGHSPRPVKGEKLAFNRWLRAKCLFVIGGGLLKAGNETYRPIYDNYKHRKVTMMGRCQLCDGTGLASQPKKDNDGRVSTEKGKKKACWNCVGAKDDDGNLIGYTPDRAPWGRGDAHRHQAALRVMVKQFLLDFHIAWRTVEGLPVSKSYHEEKQGHVHGEVA